MVEKKIIEKKPNWLLELIFDLIAEHTLASLACLAILFVLIINYPEIANYNTPAAIAQRNQANTQFNEMMANQSIIDAQQEAIDASMAQNASNSKCHDIFGYGNWTAYDTGNWFGIKMYCTNDLTNQTQAID